jgi:cytochrome P450
MSPDNVSLTDPDLYTRGDPFSVWQRLRKHSPVSWAEPTATTPGFWSVTRYADIVTVSRAPHIFSSSKGYMLGVIDPNVKSPTVGKHMISSDPPRHGRLRKLASSAFTPTMVARLEVWIRGLVSEILDGVIERGRCDFVADVARLIPLAVIAHQAGIPRDRWAWLGNISDRVLATEDTEYRQAGTNTGQSRAAAQTEAMDYYSSLIPERRANPGNDLVSVLVNAKVDGESLTDEEIGASCVLLTIAGNETTRQAISGGLLTLIQHPLELRRVLDDTTRVPSAVEEILRWWTPTMHMARNAVTDTEIGGQPIRAGDWVVMWYPSANRDEAVFPDAERFDVMRSPNEHLAFGAGQHFCLGASMARLELKILFEELFKRAQHFELDGPVAQLSSYFIHGIKRMPLRIS